MQNKSQIWLNTLGVHFYHKCLTSIKFKTIVIQFNPIINYKILNMNIKEKMDNQFNELFELQDQMINLFKKTYKDGKFDLSSKGELDNIIQLIEKKYKILKANLQNEGKAFTIYLKWGDIYKADSFTINEAQESIACNKTYRWVFKNYLGIGL